MFSSLSLLVTTSLYLLAVVDAAPSAPSKRQSDNGACQQLTTNCVNAVDKSLNNVFAIESCVLAASCFNGQRPVDNFLAFVSAAKNGNSVPPPQSVNLPRVTSTVMNAISTNAKFISRQNYIDAFYGQLSATNGPWPSNADVVINYFERVAVWTAFCAGDIPFRNFQDYFQYSASVSSPGCTPVTSAPVTISRSTASPIPTVSASTGQPITTRPTSVGHSTVTISASTIVPSGPATSSSQVPSGPATSSTQIPSGPVTSSTQAPSGPVTSSTQVPSGPVTSSTQAPSGPVTSSTQVPSGPVTSSTQAPSGPVTVTSSTPSTSGSATTSTISFPGSATSGTPSTSGSATTSTISLPGSVTSSSISSSGSVTSSIVTIPGGTSSSISSSGSVTSSIITIPGGTSSSISSSGSVTSLTPSSSGSVTSSIATSFTLSPVPSSSATSFTLSPVPPSTSIPVSSSPVPSTTVSVPPPTATPPTLSSDATCQQMFFTCTAQVNTAVTNLWSIKACVLGAACVDGAHPVGTFASAVHSWKMGGSPPTAPVNQPRVSTALFQASSTDGGKTWSQQNFIDAYYSQLSSTNGPFPPNANKVIEYYKRIAAWTGFCGKAVPYMNFADYFQWSATVDGPATTC
ncbi:hypothetical protein BDZ94DRAFT_1214436 [Collybia nuda]|uniref:Uncharacterized protein n=1 Tax=Collybia nuda TaxID=64659 RepID=A0A9P5YDC4_9AGAR|nr:hypothetical protein BDZ94DRAFT_1214436 [Collybia nuda]